MMVPELQGALLDDVMAVDKASRLVYDPFAGSGTVMLESLYRGLDFHGSDVNPLAILLCQVKATPPAQTEALHAVDKTLLAASKMSPPPPRDFPGIDKWFNPDVKAGLDRLHWAIKEQPLSMRRFLWICLAETVRLVSNSRLSTFKLHIYSAEDIAKRDLDAVKVFGAVATANVDRLRDHWARMELLKEDRPRPNAFLLPGSVSEPSIAPQQQADILMTSPPYGDNKTTVPYGQHSYLPLRWIDVSDLPGGFTPSLLGSTSRIDTLSLGGSLRDADQERASLEVASPALGSFLLRIEHAPPLRKKVLAFCKDYRDAMSVITKRLKDGAFCFLTLGERRVGKETFPLVAITSQLLEANGHEVVTVIERSLPLSRKRMAAKNSLGETMAKESILVTRAWSQINE